MIQTRLALYYAALFGANGVFLPFWPVWLASRGLSPVEIGIIFACISAMRIVSTPLVAQIADRRGNRKPTIVLLAGLATILYGLYPFGHDFTALLLISLIASTSWSAGQPLAESLTVIVAREHRFEYGRVRVWGSIAFIVTALAAGHLLGGRDAEIIYQVGFVLVAGLFATTLWLPNPRVPKSETSGYPLLQILRNPGFGLFLAAAGCVQSSHGVYYAFSTLHWRSAGLNDTLIGLLWAEGVIAEIVLFAAAAPLIRRLGAERMILLGGLAGLVRWSVLASTDWLPALIVVQILHAFTFGAAHLGAIHFIARAVPAQVSATAQSVYAAAVTGIATGGSMFVSGLLYETVAGEAYFAMAALGAVGALCAAALPRTKENA